MVDDDDDADGDVAFAGVPRCVDDGDGDVLRGDRDGSHQCGCDWGGFSSVNVCGGTSVGVGPRNDGDGGGGSCCGGGDDGVADPRGADGPGAVAPVCTGDDDEYGDGVWSAETDDEVEVGGSVTGDFRGQYKKCTEAVHVGPMVQPASCAACQA